jgi:threonylcarbamoyladenosine tRNA methylthiotransferase MtaB
MTRTKRIAFYTLGCKVNQAETQAFARRFQESGFETVPFESRADVYVINTCTVTHVGDSKSRQILRQAKRSNPAALVIATGCYASVSPNDAASEGALVVRNREKSNLIAIVEQAFESSGTAIAGSPGVQKAVIQGLISPSPVQRVRAMVKAQDGCDSMCSYCIIPRARGRSRSVEPDNIVREVQNLVAEGHAEIVITGVDLGSYGEDKPEYPDLGGLVDLVLKSTNAQRIRVSSVEPGDFNPEWMKLWEDSRLCRHLHVPLQAGSDSVLRRMRRKYDKAGFLEMLVTCRSHVPGVTITTDIMAGFPGETEAEFEEGIEFVKGCAFDGMHVFPYSRRSGTAAAHMPGHVPEHVKKERSARLREVAESGRTALLRRSLGSDARVVWESQRDGVWRGISDTNIRLYTSDGHIQPSLVETRKLFALYRDGCWAGDRQDVRLYPPEASLIQQHSHTG